MNTEQGLDFTNELDQQDLATLRVAALLGNTFSLDHLLEVSKIKASKLLQLLDKLMKYNVLVQNPSKYKRTYSFAKPKLPKTIAESMSKEEKRMYLFNIINYLKKELPDNEEKLLKLAALHMQFEDDEDHFFHKKKAADLLAKSHQAENAVNLYKEIIDKLLSENRDKSENVLLIDTILAYAQIAVSFHPPATVLEVIKKAKCQAENLRNDRENALLELCLGRIEETQGNSILASSHYNKASDLAKKGGDQELLIKISKQLSLSLFWQGRVKEAIRLYESIVGDTKTLSPKMEDAWAYLMLALCYGIAGQTPRAFDVALTIKNLAEAKKYPKFQGFANAFIAAILTEANLVDQAKPYYEKAMEIGEKIGSDFVLWCAKSCMAYEFYSKGDLEKARSYLESAFYHCSKFGRHHNSCGWHFEIIWALHKANYPPIKEYSFFSEIARLMDWPDIYMKGVALRYHALSKKISGADSKAIEFLLLESERFLKESGARVELAKTWIELARLFIENKEKTLSKKWANLAYRTLTEINSCLFPPELLFLVQKKEEGARQFEGMSKIRSAAGFLPDIDAYLSRIVMVLADMFRAERLAITLKQDGTSTWPFSIAVSRNFCTEEFQQINQGPLGDLILETTKKNQPLIIDDLQKKLNLLDKNSHNGHIKSLATIPLNADGNEVLGLIYMDNLLSNCVFSKKKNLPLMTAIGTLISLSLQNSALSKQLSGYQDGYSIESFSRNQIEPDMGPFVIVGRSEGIRKVLKNAKKVAPTDTTVLILGETGSGKEMIARQIHQLSDRADKIFIASNLSSIPQGLIASELFGHEKGAFTGAEKSKPGRFEMADKGTIFLDEIGDFAMEVQVKILRVLQDGEFERVGGTKTIHSDFRLIVATNKDLHSMVAKGDFRADLFYRINAFPINVLPLRDRKEDIPELAVYFMQKYQTKNRKNIERIPNNEMQKLLEYSWPGNIRELEHIIERAVVLSENGTLIIPDLELPRHHFTEGNFSQEKLLPLDEIERRHILNVLNHVRWRISGERGAAKILALKPTTLAFRMKKLGITKLTK